MPGHAAAEDPTAKDKPSGDLLLCDTGGAGMSCPGLLLSCSFPSLPDHQHNLYLTPKNPIRKSLPGNSFEDGSHRRFTSP